MSMRSMVSIDTGINGSMVVWPSEEEDPVVHGWGRGNKSKSRLLITILETLMLYLRKYDIEVVVVERPWFGQMKGGAFQSLLFDDIKHLCETLKIAFVFLAPASVKKGSTGKGRASKAEVQAAVRKFFEERGRLVNCKSEHDYDAAAVGIAYMKRKK